jgi:hypothetical protein
MTQLIEIVVAPNGESVVQTKGFSGSSCQDASRFIEQALGQRVSEQLTAEFYQQQTTHQQSQQGT